MTDQRNTKEDKQRSNRRVSIIAIAALILALLSMILNGCSNIWYGALPRPTATVCAAGDKGDPGQTGASGKDGEAGLSAYELWLAVGNTGTIQDFLTSLIGAKGDKGSDGKIIYYGSDGIRVVKGAAGSAGDDGKSAYQLWLDAGNSGSENDFLVSLIGEAGANGLAGATGSAGEKGVNGLSAYELWLSNGNTGTELDFFDSLAGVAGATGATGAQGLSAYQVWLSNGNSGTEGQFLASLVGPAGEQGAPGVCTVGATGANGLSTYEIWLNEDNVGSEAVFLASLKGDTGDTGPQGIQGLTGAMGPQGLAGATGPQGPAGPAGTTTMGYFGSFYDMTNQQLDQTTPVPKAWSFSNVTGANNGVTMERNGTPDYTRLRFPAVGWYNIQFSTVFYKSNSSAGDVDIWFAENGVPIADSNTRLTVAGQAQTVAAWNFFYHCTDISKYVEVMWYTDAYSTLSVKTNPATTTPAKPAVPSIIMTVNQVN